MTDSTTDSGRERSRLIRRTDTTKFRKKARLLAAALGGESALHEGQLWQVRAATQLSLETEKMEADRAAGKEIDLREYGMLVDRLGRTLERLGLEPEKVEPPSGVQIVLTEIVNPDGSAYDPMEGVGSTPVIEHEPAIEHVPNESNATIQAKHVPPERIPPPERIEPPHKEPTATDLFYQWAANSPGESLDHTARILDWSDRRR